MTLRRAPRIAATLAAAGLQGTPGLHVERVDVQGRGDTVTGELGCRWTPPGGATRIVDYRYLGDDVHEIAGPVSDRDLLTAVLARATSTGECS